MGIELGRISGPLLSEDLLRNGVDLAFETDLLYLDVNNGRIGIRSDAPSRPLFVNNTINTTNLIVDTEYTVPDFSITTDTIQQLTGILYIQPDQSTAPEITAVALGTSLLRFDNNEIYAAEIDTDITFDPTGTGVTNIRNSVNINGNLHATGNITWDGDITLGNSDADNINFASDINSDIVPNYPLDPLITEAGDFLITEAGDSLVNDVLESFNLGSETKQWSNLYSNVINSRFSYNDLASVTTMEVGNFQLNSNTITNLTSDQSMDILPNGTGLAYFNNTNYFQDSTIWNQTDDALTLANTGQGYIKFTGEYGLVIPTGPTLPAEGAVTGMIRFNTDLGYVRVFNGTDWISAIGDSTSIGLDDTYEIMDTWALILG